jgi:sporulation protein YlmC with PRC-barrel domain
MLIFISDLLAKRNNLFSLHTESIIGQITYPVVDYNNLKIAAFKVDVYDEDEYDRDILLADSIAAISNNNLVVVHSVDDLSLSKDIIHISNLLELGFNMIGMKVKSERGKKLGKIVDFTLDTESLIVYQLIVKKPLVSAVFESELTINRSQITKITNTEIIVKSTDQEVKLPAKAKDETPEFTPNFTNPFRPENSPELNPAPIDNQTPGA